MKKLSLLIVLGLCAWGLCAQTGLFNLSYAITFAEADSILNSYSFFAQDSGSNMVRYYPKQNKVIDAVITFVEPKSQRVIGWFIKYNPENSKDNDEYVLQTIKQMHGEKNHYDEDTEQLIWFLSTTRTVHVMYADDGGLTVLYYDAFFSDLFDLKKLHSPQKEATEE